MSHNSLIKIYIILGTLIWIALVLIIVAWILITLIVIALPHTMTLIFVTVSYTTTLILRDTPGWYHALTSSVIASNVGVLVFIVTIHPLMENLH
jgi:hypothetical protein